LNGGEFLFVPLISLRDLRDLRINSLMEMAMKDSIGFIGPGNKGLGMAWNILKAGFPLTGSDP
jgi:hypothetical protein